MASTTSRTPPTAVFSGVREARPTTRARPHTEDLRVHEGDSDVEDHELARALAHDVTDTDTPTGDESFGHAVLAELARLFWEPEVERRGGVEATGPVRKALAVMEPEQPDAIYLNDEAQLVMTVVSTRSIEQGEDVTASDAGTIATLEPADAPPDADWAAVAFTPGRGWFIAFDLRQHRRKGRDLLGLGDQYAEAAEAALAKQLLGPAVENANAAAELAVTTLMYLADDDPLGKIGDKYRFRQGWIPDWDKLGNAPAEFSTTVRALASERSRARYRDGPVLLSPCDVAALLRSVTEMLAHARRLLGTAEPRPDQAA